MHGKRLRKEYSKRPLQAGTITQEQLPENIDAK